MQWPSHRLSLFSQQQGLLQLPLPLHLPSAPPFIFRCDLPTASASRRLAFLHTFAAGAALPSQPFAAGGSQTGVAFGVTSLYRGFCRLREGWSHSDNARHRDLEGCVTGAAWQAQGGRG
jgi:hypothetical protein